MRVRGNGWQLEFMQNVERLLGLAIDFFLTELGERIAPYLYLCWDTADNSHLTDGSGVRRAGL